VLIASLRISDFGLGWLRLRRAEFYD
jgi:hypothetical protein